MPQPPERDRPAASRAWPIAITVIAVASIVALLAGVTIHRLTSMPERAAAQVRDGLQAVRDLAAAFRTGTVETRFRAYVTSVSSTNYLQIATVDRLEVFTREDRTAILWGTLQLPEVVVSATAPVRYTAYVDFDEPWEFDLRENRLRVVAPMIRFNRPAIDASKIEFEVETGSLLRDEEAAIDALRQELTSKSHLRARELLPAVRETARDQIEKFVGNWLLHSFAADSEVEIEVVFADEIQPSSPVLAPARSD